MGKIGGKGRTEGNRSAMMGTLLAGAFIALMAETFLNNALPTIMADFRISQSTAQWLSTSYLLVVGLMIPVSAWVFSNFQSKHAFIVMMATFLTGSLVCTFSGGHFALLLTGRIIQAVAAGSLMPFIQNVVLLLFPPEKRGVALVVALGPTVGPTLSGFVLEHWSWRALFILLAILSAAILVASFFLVYTVNDRMRTHLDVASVMYSCLGFGLLLYALSAIGDRGGASVLDLGLLLAGLMVVVLFCWRQLHLESPLVNLRVFANATFNLTSLLSTLSNIAMVGVELVLPLYLQNTRGSSALVSGLVMLPGAIVMGIFNPLSGMIYQRIGARRISLLGYTVLLAGTLPMIWFGTTTSLIVVAACYALRLAGVALVMMTTFTEGINALPSELAAHGNAAASTVRQVGGSLGTAAAMMIVTIGAQSGRHGGALSAQALDRGYRWAFLFLAFIAVVGLGASFFLKSRNSETR